ncbi:MAG: THUMP domain-containing protein, partial [Chloroflexi bacterium]|nr:THUMP domain-containing protein [Chloroflexota bacterium]
MDVAIRYHELALKKKNRPWFVQHLVDNVKNATRDLKGRKVWHGAEYIGVEVEDEALWPVVSQRVQDTMGIAKYFRVYRLPLDLDAVQELIGEQVSQRTFGSFRISAHRASKKFPVKSDEMNRRLGAFVQELSGARVNLGNPELEISVDVLHKEILVYFETYPGYGGLPVGVSGHVAAMMSGGIDSPVAAFHMMKRGCRVSMVHFHSYPLVDMTTIDKAEDLAKIITRFQGSTDLYLAPLA